jgi:dTDP-4-dehydrorhamnose 3,5-epimerase
MKYTFFTLKNLPANWRGKKHYPLIKEVVVYPLKVNRDSRGILVEVLKTNFKKIYSPRYQFSQCYYSVTKPKTARDKDRWHCHPTKQIDRFVVIKGDIVVALYDWRQNSSTYGKLNLFKMGESQGDTGQYTLLVPQNVLHCFKVVSKKEAILLNFPNTLYDAKEEGRIHFKKVKFSDNSFFKWEKVEQSLKNK